MAQVIGESQAWRTVCAMLAEDGPKVSGPGCIRRLVLELDDGKGSWKEQAEKQFQQKVGLLTEQIRASEQQIAQSQADAEANIGPQIRDCQSQFSTFLTRGNIVVRLYHRIFTVPHIKAKLASARRAFDAAPLRFIQARDRLTVQKSEICNDPSRFIASMIRQQEERLQRLKQVASSPELAGASAELELATLLARLPDTFVVLHDVRLKNDRAIRYDKKWLKTAQCDHVVVGPTGVFVIESKRWSREFASRSDLFDPFEQVGRARFLCKCILGDYGYEVTPRDVIANAGARLTRSTDARGWICSPAGVCPHILDGRDSLDSKQIEGIVQVLRRYMA